MSLKRKRGALRVSKCSIQGIEDRFGERFRCRWDPPNFVANNVDDSESDDPDDGDSWDDVDQDQQDEDGAGWTGVEPGEYAHHASTSSVSWPPGQLPGNIPDPNFQPDPIVDDGKVVPPKMAVGRINLTALSQRYNLYFTAYLSSVYIYTPLSSRNHLPKIPTYILRPPQTPAGSRIPGDTHAEHAHQINHLIVGDLGNREVLVLACDDGDIIAYDTESINSYLSVLLSEAKAKERDGISTSTANSSSPTAKNLAAPWVKKSLSGEPSSVANGADSQKQDYAYYFYGGARRLTPFFAQNVGRSAWGLAVHKESRLIATTCNTHTITVFFPALLFPSGVDSRDDRECGQGDDKQVSVSDQCQRREKRQSDSDPTIMEDIPGAPSNDSGSTYQDIELNGGDLGASDLQDNRMRTRSWKRVFHPGKNADNMPSVTFTSFNDGTANRVVAADVNGNLWEFDIWKNDQGRPTLLLQHFREYIEKHSQPALVSRWLVQSWGVLAIPIRSFLPTYNLDEAFGVHSPDEIIHLSNDTHIDITRALAHVPDGGVGMPRGRLDVAHQDADGDNQNGSDQAASDEDDSDAEGTAFMNSTSHNDPYPSNGPRRSLSIWKPPRVVTYLNKHGRNPRDRYAVFRTFRFDMELRDLDTGGVSFGVLTRNALTHTDNRFRSAMWDKICHLAHIPELSLVVAGSSPGQVALISMTLPPPECGLPRGFRVEALLPRMSETDEFYRLGKLVPGPQQAYGRPHIHGIAVSPIPEREGRRRHGRRVGPRRFRLMIHYSNHVILSYELSRESEADELDGI